MKKIIFSSALLCFIAPLIANHEVILTSEMIHFLDDKPYGITAKTIQNMLLARRELKKIQFGEQTKKGVVEGHYFFEGKKYSIRSLAALESAYEMEFYQKESEYLKDKPRYFRELQELETTYNQKKSKLKAIIDLVHNEFEEKITPFAKSVHGAKEQMIVLITESCQKHNRTESFLLKWAEAPVDTEMQYFRTHVTTFKALDQFCTDFTNFLDDVMRSCPKAWAQFKKLMEEQHAHGHIRK